MALVKIKYKKNLMLIQKEVKMKFKIDIDEKGEKVR